MPSGPILLPPPTEQDRIFEQVALDDWLHRQQATLGRVGLDGRLVLNVYVQSVTSIPLSTDPSKFFAVRDVGCPILYHDESLIAETTAGPELVDDEQLSCEKRGMLEVTGRYANLGK
jgi:hypothetical protein